MYVKSRPVTAIYRILIGVVAAFLAWSFFVTYGDDSWQQFPTWAMLLVALYYICSAIATIVMGKRRSAGWTLTPTWQLATLVAVWLVFAEKIAGALPNGQHEFITQFVMPVLVTVDWLFFSKKGQLRLIDPWYTLALPTCYLAMEIISIHDYSGLNAMTLIWWVVLMMTVILVGGYAVYMLDLVMSGKLSHYIVMPKIKVIEVAEDTPKENVVETKEEHASEKPAPEKPKKHVQSEANAKTTRQPVNAPAPKSPIAPDEPAEPAKPSVPQVENRKKDNKSAQNLHGTSKH